jgi:hypothetical protein
MTGRDPFEDRLRETLRAGDSGANTPNVDAFLDDVHRGARSRRRRRGGGIAAAVALVVIGGAAAAGPLDLLDGEQAPVADQSNRTGADATVSGSSPAPSAGTVSASSEATTSSPTPIGSRGTYTTANTRIVSLTSTGDNDQWALGWSPGRVCGRPQPCATVFERPADGGPPWTPLGQLPLAAGSDDQYGLDTVNQLRYVGDPSRGFDGYAFGGGLLTTHDDPATGARAGQTWHAPALPVQGSVDWLEAHGSTVYAIVTDRVGASTLVASPTAADVFERVDTGDLGTAESLVSTAGVVAFLDHAGSTTEVVSSPADPATGSATGEWARSQPCVQPSQPIQLSSASGTLWALCDNGGVSFKCDGDTTWTDVAQPLSGPGPVLAARTADDALAAYADGRNLTSVSTAGGGDVAAVGPRPPPFAAASMLGFTNADLGFAIAQGMVWRTTDGGRHWSVDPILPAG